MIKLSPQREKFAQEIAKGSNQTEAYYTAYPTSKKWTKDSVYVKASQLASDDKVRLRIEEIRAPAIKKLNITVEGLLQEIEDLKKASIEKDKKLALDCIKEQGKLAGLYVDRKELTGKDGSSLAGVQKIYITAEQDEEVDRKSVV